MRAVLLTGHGGTDKLVLCTDVPVPRPTAGEVLIKIAAAGVNNTDINTRTGWYQESVSSAVDAGWTGDTFQFPRIQGADACGTVVAVGDGVEAAVLGTRVIVEPVFRAPGAPLSSARYFGSECDGAFAEYAVAPLRHVYSVRCDWSDVELASVSCAFSAAENMVSRAGISAGETVLVTGASGGVGSASVQLIKRRGAHVIAVCSADKIAGVRALGADEVIDRATDFGAVLGGERVDAVIDMVGGAAFAAILPVLKRGGRYASAGAIGGAQVALDLRSLYLKDLSLFGCTVLGADVFPNLVGYIERGEIRPVVAATYPLADIAMAQTAFLTKRHIGKLVLTI